MEEWEPGFEHGLAPTPGARVLAFAEGRLVVASDEPLELPRLEDVVPAGGTDLWPVGRLGGEAVFAVAAGDSNGAPTKSLRAILAEAPAPLAAAAGRAAQIVEWELAHAFCGRCGERNVQHDSELARICPACGAHYYPRITPAVIMLVERDRHVLLARRAGLRTPFFSVLAGFVEPGETLEQTVQREVREEVGIDVDDVRYFGSQPWPFPSQLMIGFTARHAGGEIRVDDHELAEADWYMPDRLPQIPGPFTIARWLIDDFLRRAAV